MKVDFDEIKKIIDKFNGSSMRELEINKGDFHLHLSKNETTTQDKTSQRPLVEKQNSVDDLGSNDSNSSTSKKIISPMVGTVYLQPEPGAEKYVKAGQMVHEGDIVCVIEAMKMLTEIKSDVTGKIRRVIVENGDLVEFDQPLFEIEEA